MKYLITKIGNKKYMEVKISKIKEDEVILESLLKNIQLNPLVKYNESRNSLLINTYYRKNKERYIKLKRIIDEHFMDIESDKFKISRIDAKNIKFDKRIKLYTMSDRLFFIRKGAYLHPLYYGDTNKILISSLSLPLEYFEDNEIEVHEIDVVSKKFSSYETLNKFILDRV